MINPVGYNKKNGKIITCRVCGAKKYRNLSSIKHANGNFYCGRVCQVKGTNNGFKNGHLSFLTKDSIIKMSKSKMGHIVSTKTRKKISKNGRGKSRVSGEKHYKWIKDRSKLKRYNGSNEKRSPIYKNWRYRVAKRDHYCCKINNKECFGGIEVHNILSWRDYPELRFNINNGITLCHAHHPRKRAEEKRLIPIFKELVSVSKG